MATQFHVLASGSSGNASVLVVDGLGVLIDFGISVRSLEQRMRWCGLSWKRIRAVVLSHTHGDHWQAATLTQLAKQGIPIYCHADHAGDLERSRAYTALTEQRLLRYYEPGQRLTLHGECACLPIAVEHDGAMTCGFRFEGRTTFFGIPWAVGYATDLGSWSAELASLFADVEILALEFNHDIAMQISSGRHPYLIRRVLSDQGHLSNEQAAAFLAEILRQSAPGRLQSLVQLHLSRECNHPDLARQAAQQVLDRVGANTVIHTAQQDRPRTTIRLGRPTPTIPRRRRPPLSPAFIQPLLPYSRSDSTATTG